MDRAALQFDWSRVAMPLRDQLISVYRTFPDTSYMLYALNKGGSWRWGIVLQTTSTPIHETSGPTLYLCKRNAELWYLEHGGQPSQQPLLPAATTPDSEWEELPF